MLAISPIEFKVNIDPKETWFGENSSEDLIIAAIEYLGTVGDHGVDVDWVHLIGRPEANIATAAVRAYARILAKTNTTEALKFVARHEGTDLDKELTEKLLVNISTVETEVLRDCLKNKTNNFQIAIAAELFSRSAISDTDAQLMCESADADVRLIGVRALARLKPELALADARKILVRPRRSNALSILAAPQGGDFQRESAFQKYKIDSLGERPFDQLIELQRVEGLYSTEATLALYLHHFKRVKARLEENLLDGFGKFFDSRRAAAEGSPMAPSEAVYTYLKEQLNQTSFEIYCAFATKSDLILVRAILDKHNIKFSNEIPRFLAKHGQWEDAERVVKLSQNLNYGPVLSLLSLDFSGVYRHAANALLKLSRKRVADVWKLDLPDSLRVQLVVQMPKSLLLAFDDAKIINMLLSNSDVIREAVALKAILNLPKGRLRKILKQYYKVEGKYFYNVIFWLDLGISADRSISGMIALKKLSAL